MNQSVAFVSGGTSGIGYETAKMLMENGYQVILCGRREDRLSEIKKQWGEKVVIWKLDVTDRETLEKLIQSHLPLLAQLRLIVNNAGLALGREPFQTASINDFERMMDTNVKGLINTTKLLLPFLIEAGEGFIVNLGSVAGRWIYPGGGVYCASKHAVRAISEGLRLDLLGKNIRVTNIEPGMVETEFSLVRFGDAEKAKAVYEGMTPLTGRDIAETILWCVQRPQHVNIQEIVIYPTDQASITQVHRR
jgi:3-hydroxy acid dehydrogenase/malonic semialdehyde reductase